jgi:tetraprenyl-beta-curcumene synthase
MYAESRSESLAAFIRAALIYWLDIYPCLRRELREWRTQAETIPDPILRDIALGAQRKKLGNIEGAVAFAVLAPPSNRTTAMRAMASYEATFDYIDCLCEMPAANPIANGHQLSQALIIAVTPDADHKDYYAFHSLNDDNGYLHHLVDRCRDAFCSLPANSTVSEVAQRASSRIAAYQSLNHGDAVGSHKLFVRWAKREAETYKGTYPGEDIRWWEIAASAGSSLVVFALMAAAANPDTLSTDAQVIERVYYPWVGAVNSLLDSMVDLLEDSGPGQHRLLDYYNSSHEIATRIASLVTQCSRKTRTLYAHHMHSLIFAAMVSFYLTAPEAGRPEIASLRESISKATVDFDQATMIVMEARRAMSKIGTIGKTTTCGAT